MIAYKTSKNAKIMFVGINPHPGSYRRGVPFSNNKMFWYLLNRSGLIAEADSDLKDDRSLKRIYERKFLTKYSLNFLKSCGPCNGRRDAAKKRGETGGCQENSKNHSGLQAEGNLLHREDRLQHILRQPEM